MIRKFKNDLTYPKLYTYQTIILNTPPDEDDIPLEGQVYTWYTKNELGVVVFNIKFEDNKTKQYPIVQVGQPSDPLQGGQLQWQGDVEYNEKSLVYYDGKFYVSLKSNNIGNQPHVSVTYWKEYSVYVQRIATGELLGSVKVDNTKGIKIDSAGMLSVSMEDVMKFADSPNVSLNVNKNGELLAQVQISQDEDNALTDGTDGLFVEKQVFIVDDLSKIEPKEDKIYFDKATKTIQCYVSGKQIFVTNNVVSGKSSQNKITLTLKDGSTFDIDTKNLIKTGDTDSLQLKNESGLLSGNVKIDPQVDNQIKITPGGGLYVPSFGDATALYCYSKQFTRVDDDVVVWQGDVMTVTHNMNTRNLLSLQIRHITENGERFYNHFSPYMVNENTFQVNVPSAFDLSEGTWQIFAPMLLSSKSSETEMLKWSDLCNAEVSMNEVSEDKLNLIQPKQGEKVEFQVRLNEGTNSLWITYGESRQNLRFSIFDSERNEISITEGAVSIMDWNCDVNLSQATNCIIVIEATDYDYDTAGFSITPTPSDWQ